MHDTFESFSICCEGDFFFSDSEYTSILYVRTPGGCFPSEGWTDFPETVLDWWVRELKRFFWGENGSYRLRFMDGPYEIRCARKGERLTLSFLKYEAKTLPDCEVTLRELAQALNRAIETQIRQLYLVGHSTRNMEDLHKELSTVLPYIEKRVMNYD